MDLISVTEQVMKIAGLTEQEESVLRTKYRLDGAKPLPMDQQQRDQTEAIALRKLQKVDFSVYI